MTLTLRRKTGIISFCGAGSPLAEKRTMKQAPGLTRKSASPVGNVLRSVHSKPSFPESRIVWMVPAVMSAAVATRSVPRMQLSFPRQFKNFYGRLAMFHFKSW